MNNNKSKQIWVIIVAIALIFAGFLWYRSYSAKNKNMQLDKIETKGPESSLENTLGDDEIQAISDEEADAIEAEEENFNAICENGEWVKIADLSGNLSSFSGKLRKVYPDEESASEFPGSEFYLEGTEKIALAGANLEKMDYFEDREIEVQGVRSAEKKEVAVAQVKCGGAETDKNLLDQRNKMLNYISGNINSISPKKAPYKKWTALSAEFVDENNVYVEYYDIAEDEEDIDVPVDTGRQILLGISAKPDGSYSTQVLAYFEMGEDEYVLKSGTDKFEETEDTVSYDYDSESNTWERY
jgi:hypothetical protein